MRVDPMERYDLLDDLARRARRWIAVEDLLFEALGRWSRELPGAPAARRAFGTWCGRHAWHAELWRERLPAGPGHDGGDDVEAWIAPLRNALDDVGTAAEAVAALTASVLPALDAAVAEHRDAVDPLLDGPTARVLDLVAADLTSERVDLTHPSVS
jgi:hypothetical protein